MAIISHSSSIAQPASALEMLMPNPHWVCYSDDKIPFDPSSGRRAKADVVSTWSTYENAVDALKKNRGKYAGIGREVLAEEELLLIDLDDCINEDGEIGDYAWWVIKHVNSYAEYSPSGTGIHIWASGDNLPDNLGPDPNGKIKIEIYDHGRYFTWTGKHVEGTPNTIEERSEEVLEVYQDAREMRGQTRELKRKVNGILKEMKNGTPYGKKALRNECAKMAKAVKGGRNHQLNKSAFALGKLIAGKELDRDYVEQELGEAAENAGLDYPEIESTMRSGIDAGMHDPRSAPDTWAELKPSINGHIIGNGIHADVTPGELANFTADDAGNGDAMMALFGNDFLYCGSRGWFMYVGTHWQVDNDSARVRQQAVETLRLRRHAAIDAEKEAVVKCTKADESRVNGCISRFKTLASVSIDEFDNDPDLLNCKNGVVDLRTGHIIPHTRAQRFTYCVPAKYELSDCSEWLEYLKYVIGGGQPVIDYLQMLLGYSLTGHTREEILIYLCGPTRSGKGTLAETFMALLPNPLSTMVDFNSFTTKREGDVSNFDLAPLKPSRMIFASESNRSQSLNPAKIKQLTGGDMIRACFKHKDFFSYRPQFKVWMMSNHPVNGDPEDEALWGRVRVIEFPTSFLGVEDKTKKARLKEPEQLKGILYWAVQGAIKWSALGAAGLSTPEAVAEITRAQRNELDYVQQWLEECTENDGNSWMANEDVIASYLEWCKNNNVQFPKGPKSLTHSLKAKGYEVGKQKKEKGKNRKGVGGLYIPERATMSVLDRMKSNIKNHY